MSVVYLNEKGQVKTMSDKKLLREMRRIKKIVKKLPKKAILYESLKK